MIQKDEFDVEGETYEEEVGRLTQDFHNRLSAIKKLIQSNPQKGCQLLNDMEKNQSYQRLFTDPNIRAECTYLKSQYCQKKTTNIFTKFLNFLKKLLGFR
jgi:hypothetical protein